jgi:hypothetical protein
MVSKKIKLLSKINLFELGDRIKNPEIVKRLKFIDDDKNNKNIKFIFFINIQEVEYRVSFEFTLIDEEENNLNYNLRIDFDLSDVTKRDPKSLLIIDKGSITPEETMSNILGLIQKFSKTYKLYLYKYEKFKDKDIIIKNLELNAHAEDSEGKLDKRRANYYARIVSNYLGENVKKYDSDYVKSEKVIRLNYEIENTKFEEIIS